MNSENEKYQNKDKLTKYTKYYPVASGDALHVKGQTPISQEICVLHYLCSNISLITMA